MYIYIYGNGIYMSNNNMIYVLFVDRDLENFRFD